MSVRASFKAERFTESVIREMTRLSNLHGAVNLSQGFPDFAAPEPVKEAARQAVASDVNQYAITWGARPLRQAIARKFERLYGVPVDPEREVTVTCGSTEAMIATLLAVLNPGDEIVAFEPFYENYGPDAILSGAVPRFVRLRPPEWSFDPAELAAAFSDKTRAIIVNSPQNPTGKVFSREELEARFARVAGTSPERAAAVIVAGVRRGRRRVLVGPDARWISALQRLLPVRYQDLVAAGAKRRGAMI